MIHCKCWLICQSINFYFMFFFTFNNRLFLIFFCFIEDIVFVFADLLYWITDYFLTLFILNIFLNNNLLMYFWYFVDWASPWSLNNSFNVFCYLSNFQLCFNLFFLIFICFLQNNWILLVLLKKLLTLLLTRILLIKDCLWMVILAVSLYHI